MKESLRQISYLFAAVFATAAHAELPSDYFTGAKPRLELYEGEERKVCTTGKPCGNTCININYTCHSDTPAPAPYYPPAPTPSPAPTPAPTPAPAPSPTPAPAPAPEIAVKPPPASCTATTLLNVVDGDTISIRNAAGQRESVRLNQIDAPEKSQFWGSMATVCLSNILRGASLEVCPDGKDRYGRTIAAVKANGSDVGVQMVSQGCAWAFTRYLESNSPLPALQNAAQAFGLGLWAYPNPQAPWDYRAGVAPVTVAPATGSPAVVVSTATVAQTWDRVFDWAEHKYPDTLRDGTDNNSLADGTVYRCYPGPFCLGYRNGQFLTYDGNTISPVPGIDGVLLQVGSDGF